MAIHKLGTDECPPPGSVDSFFLQKGMGAEATAAAKTVVGFGEDNVFFHPKTLRPYSDQIVVYGIKPEQRRALREAVKPFVIPDEVVAAQIASYGQ